MAAPRVREADGDTTVLIAVGSHEPDARELADPRDMDAALLGRATVVVEDVATARAGPATSCWRLPRAH